MTAAMPGTRRPRRALLRRLLKVLASGVGIALGRFPSAILAIAGLGILANVEIADSRLLDGLDIGRLVLALTVAAAFSVAATLVPEAKHRSGSVRLAAGFLAALVSGALVWLVGSPSLFAPPLLLASMLAIPLAPFIRGSNSLRFWTFAVWTLLGCALGFASVMLFVLGVSAIVEMVRYLFDIGVGAAAYQHVYATAFVFVGPIFALGRIPRDFHEEADESRSDRLLTGIKAVSDWISAPVVIVMAVLLHAYAGKILATADIPSNRLGWIVSTFATIVLTQRFVIEPFRTSGGIATRLFRRFWAVGLVAPVLLLAYAIHVRVGDEGWTAQRYALAMIAASSALLIAAQLVPKLRGDVRLVAAIPAALLALSSFGPWGLPQTVGRSQAELIRAEFADAAGRIRAIELTEGERDRLRSRIEAMSEVEALSVLVPMLPVATVIPPETGTDLRDAILKALALDYGRPNALLRTFAAGRGAAFDVLGFDTVYSGVATDAADTAPASASLDGNHLRLRIGATADEIDLGGVAGILPATREDGRSVEPAIADRTTAGGRTLRFRILSATIEGDRITQLAFDLALKRDEWPR